MPLQAVEPRRLYRQIAEQLARLIDTGEYAPGDRLPPERTLAEKLAVSRPSVREALIALEVEGRIEIRGGSGIYVANRDGRARQSKGDEHPVEPGPFELLEARRLIEPEIAGLAARNTSPALVARLEEAIAGMERADASRLGGLDHDRLFHEALADGCGNTALALVLATLWDNRVGPLYVRLEQHFHSAPIWRQAIDEHRAILDAVRAGDVRGAKSAMLRHIRNARDRFSMSWQATTPK